MGTIDFPGHRHGTMILESYDFFFILFHIASDPSAALPRGDSDTKSIACFCVSGVARGVVFGA